MTTSARTGRRYAPLCCHRHCDSSLFLFKRASHQFGSKLSPSGNTPSLSPPAYVGRTNAGFSLEEQFLRVHRPLTSCVSRMLLNEAVIFQDDALLQDLEFPFVQRRQTMNYRDA